MSIEFLPVATPHTESELAVMACLLDANEIHYFVHNRFHGGLYPGMQIPLYNRRRFMVRADQAQHAAELLSVFFQPMEEKERKDNELEGRDILRVIFEILLFGWCFPQRRRRNLKDMEGDGDVSLVR
jgi:hypothetical protein